MDLQQSNLLHGTNSRVIPKLHEGFFNLLADDYWKDVVEFSQRKWVTIEEFKNYYSPIYGEKEVDDGIDILQHAAAEARNYILSNPTELPFQMITRVNDSACTNEVVHMFIKCLLIYSDHPVVFAPGRCWDKPGGPLKMRIPLMQSRVRAPRSLERAIEVKSIQLSPGSNDIISTCINDIVIIQKKTGMVLYTLKGHRSTVNSIAVTADGKWIVSGSSDKSVIVWDRESGKQHGPPLTAHTDRVSSVAISADGRWIVSGSWDKSVIVWDRESGKQHGPPLTAHTNGVTSVAISADGKWIVSASWYGYLVVWDLARNIHTSLLPEHRHCITSVAISADGKWIVSSSTNTSVLVWNRESGDQHGPLLAGHKENITSVAISADGKWIASGSDDKSVIVWDRESEKQQGPPLTGHMYGVTSVAISADGKWIVSGSYDNYVIVWDRESGTRNGPSLTGHNQPVRCMELSADGKWIVSGSDDKSVIVWDRMYGKQHGPPRTAHTDMVNSVAISADGKWILSGSWDKSVIVWDRDSGKQHGPPLTAHTNRVSSVAISADGKWIASEYTDKSVIVWERQSGKQHGPTLTEHTNGVSSVAISADGKWIVYGSDDKSVIVWDRESGKQHGPPLTGHTDIVRSVAISADGKWIVSGAFDGTVIVWDREYGKHHGLIFFRDRDSVNSVAMSKDDKWIGVGCNSGSLLLSDMGVESYTFQDTNCSVASVIVSLQVFANLVYGIVAIVVNDSLIVGDISSLKYCSISVVGLGKISDISFQGSSDLKNVLLLTLLFDDGTEKVFAIRKSIGHFETNTSGSSELKEPSTSGNEMQETSNSERGQTKSIGISSSPGASKDEISRSYKFRKLLKSFEERFGQFERTFEERFGQFERKEKISSIQRRRSKLYFTSMYSTNMLVNFCRSELFTIEELNPIMEAVHQSQPLPRLNSVYSKGDQIVTADSHKVLASLPSEIYEGDNGLSFCQKTGTIIAFTIDGPVYSLKLAHNVNSYRVADFMDTIASINGYEASAQDISLFQCFTESEERLWYLQDSAFLNQFSDGIGIYSDPSEIPTVLQIDSENVSTLTIQSEESEETKEPESDATSNSQILESLSEAIEAVSGNSSHNTDNDTGIDTGVNISVNMVVVFDIRYLTPIGLSALFWLLPPCFKHAVLMEGVMKNSNFNNCFLQKVTGIRGAGPNVPLVIPQEWTYLFGIDETFISEHSMRSEDGTDIGDFGTCLLYDNGTFIPREPKRFGLNDIFSRFQLFLRKTHCSTKVLYPCRFPNSNEFMYIDETTAREEPEYRIFYFLEKKKERTFNWKVGGSISVTVMGILQGSLYAELSEKERKKMEVKINRNFKLIRFNNFNHFCRLSMQYPELQESFSARLKWIKDVLSEQDKFPEGSNQAFLTKLCEDAEGYERLQLFRDGDCSVHPSTLALTNFGIRQSQDDENGTVSLSTSPLSKKRCYSDSNCFYRIIGRKCTGNRPEEDELDESLTSSRFKLETFSIEPELDFDPCEASKCTKPTVTLI